MAYTKDQITAIITQEANALGIPPEVALAIANQESGLNSASVGDNGHSVGLFQLNDQGEGHGLSVAAREDPVTNARIALTQVANVMKANPTMSWGDIAAAAQRPQDRTSYASAINTALGPVLANKALGVAGTLSGTNQGSVPGNTTTPIDLKSFALANGFPPQWLNDPELGPLIDQFANNDISIDQFNAAKIQTQIWRSTPQSVRDAEIAQAQNPADLAKTVQQIALRIHNEASVAGVQMTPAQELDLATQVNSQGLDQEQENQAVAAHLKTLGGGTAGTDANTLKSLYSDYALPPPPDQQLQQQVQQVLAGSQTVDGIRAGLVQQAKALYSTNPQLAQYIGGTDSTTGLPNTVKQWAQPYLSTAATTLGLNPNSIDLNAPMWRAVLSPGTDAKGQSTGAAMSLDQWETQIRTSPQYGFDSSSTAISEASNLATGLAQKLGFGA